MINISILPFLNFSNQIFSIVDELIFELDPNHNGQITQEEFNLIMKYIEQKQQ